MSKPQQRPFGETQYLNYDPEQINTVADAIELFRWLSSENKSAGNKEAAGAFEDCANLLEDELQG